MNRLRRQIEQAQLELARYLQSIRNRLPPLVLMIGTGLGNLLTDGGLMVEGV